MRFDNAWVLTLIWLPVAWAVWEWRRSNRHLAVVLKASSLVAIVLALAQPILTVFESRVAVAVLADTSASLAIEDLRRASDIASRIEKGRGRNWTRVIPFARQARQANPAERGQQWKLEYTSGEAGRGTNLEVGLRSALAALPADLVPRVALVSDGHENTGSVVRAVWQAQQLGIPIDTFALKGRPQPLLRLESVVLPAQVFSGERFPLDVAVSSPGRAMSTVEVSAEGKLLGNSSVALEKGVNRFRVMASLASKGAIDLMLRVRAGTLGEVSFEHAVSLRKPKALLVSPDLPAADAFLTKTLEANQYDVERVSLMPAGELGGYQLIILSNWDLEGIPPVQKASIEGFVKQGGGLLVVGGERNNFLEDKPAETPLDRVLPAKVAPPRSPEGTCVVLIVDKSSSMEGKKIELARVAAIGVVGHLRPIDMVGILIFDNSFQWQVPIRRAEDRSLIKRLVSGITPDGGTQIAPALSEAYRRIAPANAIYKHIVLLTDGISEEGDSLSLSKEAASNKVTISTVGLGQDVNRAYLEKVATFAKGKAYFMNDPSGLEQILLKDVMEHTGSTVVEREVRALVARQTEVLDGVEIEKAPVLHGFVRYIAKPTAETILKVDQKEPLYVRWQYGLGRAAVFTSDAKARWAANWIAWPGNGKLWTNVLRDLLPHSPPSEATASYDSSNDELVVDYRLGSPMAEPAKIPDIFLFGPEHFQSPVHVVKLAAGAYRGRLAIGRRQGLFRIRPLEESRAFPEIGFYREEEELAQYGSNEFLLRQIAEITGGRFNPDPIRVFDTGGRTVPAAMRLWPGLLALAVLLSLAELILRKWASVVETLRGDAIN